MRILIVLAFFLIFWSSNSIACYSQCSDDELEATFIDIDLLLAFQGKGSSLFFDAGMVSLAFERIPAMQRNRVVISGNSSGSIWSAYFANKGFTSESISGLAKLAKRADVSAIRKNESISYKFTKVLLNEVTEMDPVVLLDAISIALDVEDISDCKTIKDIARKSAWKPNHPFVIVAANLDAIGRMDEESRNLIDRKIDYENYDVYWSLEAFDKLSKNPEVISDRNLLITWDGNQRIGKAATYFCDPATYALLSKLPESERLADLRLVTTPEDAALAIHASLAEPTYFEPVEEFDYNKLNVGGGLGEKRNIKKRMYYGGFIMPVIAQDLRRMLPHTRAIGTGWIGLPKLVRVYFDRRWGLDVELLHHKSNWWLDAELRPSKMVERQIAARQLTTEQEFELGRQTAKDALASGITPPQYAIPCKLNWHPKYAINFDSPTDGDSKVKTLRGLDGLISN